MEKELEAEKQELNELQQQEKEGEQAKTQLSQAYEEVLDYEEDYVKVMQDVHDKLQANGENPKDDYFADLNAPTRREKNEYEKNL